MKRGNAALAKEGKINMESNQSWKSFNPAQKRPPENLVGTIVEQVNRAPVNVQEIGDIANNHGQDVNCYPSLSSEACCGSAFFVSLTSKHYRKGRGHYYFNEILQKLIQHMQGAFPGKTNRAVVITDSFEPDEFQKRKLNIDENRKTATVDFYLISSSGYTLLTV